MPIYEFSCKKCNHVFDEMLSMNEYDLPLSQPCPSCQATDSVNRHWGTAPSIGDPVRLGITKPPQGFKDLMNHYKSVHPGGNLKGF